MKSSPKPEAGGGARALCSPTLLLRMTSPFLKAPCVPASGCRPSHAAVTVRSHPLSRPALSLAPSLDPLPGTESAVDFPARAHHQWLCPRVQRWRGDGLFFQQDGEFPVWAVAVISPQFLETEPWAAVGIRSLSPRWWTERSQGWSLPLAGCAQGASGPVCAQTPAPGTGPQAWDRDAFSYLPSSFLSGWLHTWKVVLHKQWFGERKESKHARGQEGQSRKSLFILAPSPVLSLGSTSSK